MYKQIIIVRKDLQMSVGKICSQVSHASMAFLTNQMKKYYISPYGLNDKIECHVYITHDCFYQWINDSFTKCVLQASNKNHLLKAKTMAEEMGMKEGKDFFLICDNCRTELEPEFVDENGVGRTLTCIGFTPMDSEIIDKIGKKYHLYI